MLYKVVHLCSVFVDVLQGVACLAYLMGEKISFSIYSSSRSATVKGHSGFETTSKSNSTFNPNPMSYIIWKAYFFH